MRKTMQHKTHYFISHLYGALSVILMVRQDAPSEHKVAWFPVLHDGPLLLQPAFLQRFLHQSLAVEAAWTNSSVCRYHTFRPRWFKERRKNTQLIRCRSSSAFFLWLSRSTSVHHKQRVVLTGGISVTTPQCCGCVGSSLTQETSCLICSKPAMIVII